MGAVIAAGIDVGTHAAKSVVVRLVEGEEPKVLHGERRVTRLGEGLAEEGRLSDAAVERTCAAVAEMAETARARGAAGRIRVAATSAARDAANAFDLVRCARERAGVALEVITGEEEARLTLAGVSAFLRLHGPFLLVDPGGGSTEWIFASGNHVESAMSVGVGAVRVYGSFLKGSDPPHPARLEEARAYLSDYFAAAAPAGSRPLVGTGGTLRCLASVAARRDGRRRGARLDRVEVARQVALYATMSVGERRRVPGMDPDRADIILAGALVVEAVMARAGADAMAVTNVGLRHGLACSAVG